MGPGDRRWLGIRLGSGTLPLGTGVRGGLVGGVQGPARSQRGAAPSLHTCFLGCSVQRL